MNTVDVSLEIITEDIMCKESVKRHIIQDLAPDGLHKTISIKDEQAAPMADLAAFKEQIDTFTCEDYYGDAPYDLLVHSSQFAWNQYDQFASILIKAAHTVGVEAGVAEDAVKMYRDIFIGMTGEATDILTAIKSVATDTEYKDKVSVLSIPCGSGKSTALTKLIYDVIKRDNGEGLIIVTDSVERMGEYWKQETANPAFDNELLHFIRLHRNDVVVISRQNYDQMKMRQHYAPVIVLTTQRYFGWTQERIKELTRWQKGTRPLIIFDEAPYLSEERDITVDKINVVSSALRMCIEATDETSCRDKQAAIAFWESIRKHLLEQMDKLEYTPDLQYAFIPGKESDTLQALLAYVYEHRSELNTNILSITQIVEDVVHLLQDWGIYSHRASKTSGKYESKYTVHVDHRDLLNDLGAKVIILDGTADISPMYDEDYIDMPRNRGYSRNLSCLTIKLCDLPTGESDLRADPTRTAKMIHAYLAAVTDNDRNLVIFSNEKMEVAFRREGFDEHHTGHFNNIKGLNSYSTAQNIAQIGANRKPPVDYLTLDLARNEEVRTQLAVESANAAIVAMNTARKALDYSRAIMTRHVLADMEQNMYRGIIRNADNTQPFTYYVFFDHQQYAELIKEIRNRYIPLGAKVQIVKRATVEAYKPKNPVDERIETFEKWFDVDWDGTPIRQSKAYLALGMDQISFKNMLANEKAATLRAKLDKAKEYAQSLGKKNGWIAKSGYPSYNE